MRSLPKGVGIAFLNGNSSQNNLFKDVAKGKGNRLFTPTSGKEFLRNLQEVTNEQCGNCIKLLNIAGHGYTRRGAHAENGVPGVGDNVGFYNSINWLDSLFDSSADIDDLDKLIKRGSIRFCKTCLIQIHSCRIGSVFASNLAVTTGCQVVFASGSCFIENGLWYSARSDEHESKNYLGEAYLGFKIADSDGRVDDLNRKPGIYQSTYNPVL